MISKLNVLEKHKYHQEQTIHYKSTVTNWNQQKG